MNDPSTSPPHRDFELLLHDGISAVKAGRHMLAQSLLRQAALLGSGDARPYIWLSATTDDPHDQLQYLEQAVAIDPANATARRGLALLSGKLNLSQLIPEGHSPVLHRPVEPQEAQAETFLCPQCGGRMSFAIRSDLYTCEYCGHTQALRTNFSSEQVEQVLDYVVPTQRGHRWAEAEHHLACARCGAHSLLSPGQWTSQCPYCGSNQLIASPERAEIIEPQAILLMKVDAAQVRKNVRAWLGGGLFAPDDLLHGLRQLNLRPAYISCWTFDGALEMKWTCEVNEGNSRAAQWTPRSGSETVLFDDVLVPGLRNLESPDLARIEPFDIKNALEFNPAYLAGWPALIYNRSLADASLLAREQVSQKLRRELYHRIEPGRQKRNLEARGGAWSGLTFKHILLPLWIGTYHYRGKNYPLLVNGATGKVGGHKPHDYVKIIFALLSLALGIFLLALLIQPGMR